MDQDRIAGTARNFGGKVEEGFGRVTGDPDTQIQGKVDQAIGTAQDLYGQAKDAAADAATTVKRGAVQATDHVRDFITQRPYTTAAIALLVGWAIARVGRSQY